MPVSQTSVEYDLELRNVGSAVPVGRFNERRSKEAMDSGEVGEEEGTPNTSTSTATALCDQGGRGWVWVVQEVSRGFRRRR